MNWLTAPLRKIAPPSPASCKFAPNEETWHLSLDQIESDTGEIIGKRYAAASEAGTSTFCFDTGNVLYSKLRPYLNKVTIPDEPGIATTELIPLRPDPAKLNPRFLAYYLRSPGFANQASHHVAGAKMPRVVMDWFWDHEAPLPTPKEQARIVELLDEADRLRRLRREADAKAARILPALFLKMFGDPATNPMAWPVRSLSDFVEAASRRNPSTCPDETFQYIDIAGVDGERGEITTTKTLAGRDAPSRARQVVRSRDTLVSTVRPYLRATALVPEELDGEIASTGFCVLRPRRQHGYAWLFQLTRQQWFTEQLNIRARGASYPAVTDADIFQLSVPIPTSQAALEQFDGEFESMSEVLSNASAASAKVNQLFSLLLQRAFSGQLTAKWREAHIQELLAEMEEQARLLNLPLPKELEAVR